MNGKRIFRNIALAVLVAFGVAIALGAVGKRSSSLLADPELKQFVDNRIIPLDGEGLSTLIETHKPKKQIVFLYASWCPYCKRQFTQLHQLEGALGKSRLAVHYVSTERNVYDLGEFLQNTYQLEKHELLTPYHVPGDKRESFLMALRGKGATPTDNVPFLILFNEEGNFAGQFRGLTYLPDLLAAVEK